MDNPFAAIEKRLCKIEDLILDLQSNYISNVNKSDDQLLTVDQTAELLNLATQTIYGLVSRREIPHRKRGKRLYFTKSEIIDWLSQGRRSTKEEVFKGTSINGRVKS